MNRVVLWWLHIHGKQLVVHGQEHLQGRTGPLILSANHLHAADAFYINMAVPRELLPTRFLGTLWFKTRFLSFLSILGIIPLFYKLAGVITVQKGRGIEKNLKKPLEILKAGGVIFIFPEGTRNTSTEPLLQLRRGAAALAIEAHAPIVPIIIRYEQSTVHITIGEPFILNTTDYDEGTAIIREHLMNVVVKI